MEKFYSYLLLYRPPMPGGIPREGLIETEGWERREERYGTMCWGIAVYNRPLTEKEIRNYELAPLELGYEREMP